VFLSPIDLAKNELQNARIQNLGTAPSTPAVGQVYTDTAASLNLPRVWNGSAWMLMGGRLDQLAAPTASVSMNSQLITNVLNPVGAQDAATRGYVLGLKITDLTAPTTAVAFNSQQLTGVADPSAAQHAATQNYVVTRTLNNFAAPTAAVSFNSQQITNLLDPSAAQHAATQNFVVTRKVTDLAAPTAAFSMNSQKITSLGTPTTTGDAAEYAWVQAQVEAARQGISYKTAVRVAATTNVTLATPGATINGVTMVAGDRMLLTNQTTTSEIGIYVWNGAATPATRATDADVFTEVQDGTQVYVREGTDAEKVYRQTASLTSFTGQSWTIAAAGGSYVAGAGLTDTANTFDIVSGAGTGITVNANNITNDWTLTARKMTGTLGNGSLTAITITHNWATRAVQHEVWRATTPWDTVEPDFTRPDTNSVTFTFSVAPTTNQYEYVIVG
jgi:hypothetical protein